jgi:uncharacterized Zn-binding protein involved in type VI secretion
MAYKRLARIGDTCAGRCWAPSHSGATVNWTGVITTGTGGFFIGSIQAARVGDTGTTSCGHTFYISAGSPILTGPGGVIIAREDDPIIVHQGGDGVITSGSDTCSSF